MPPPELTLIIGECVDRPQLPMMTRLSSRIVLCGPCPMTERTGIFTSATRMIALSNAWMAQPVHITGPIERLAGHQAQAKGSQFILDRGFLLLFSLAWDKDE